jgi:CRP-like cAMP-binding protein
MKTCKCCGVSKPETEFYRRSSGTLRAQCKACKLKVDAAHRLANVDARRAQQKQYHAANREHRVAQMRQRYDKVRHQDVERRRADYQAHRERELDTAREYYEANKEQAAARKKDWVARNRGKVNAFNKARKVRALMAMPPWADREKIETVYRIAEEFKALGLDVHVDHIIPLQGKTVSGLHVHDNLRVILASDNISKGNKLLACAEPTALHELA